MNVVTPPPNENAVSRRRRDAHENWHRTLEWATRRGDIDVHPHSPLAISDILTQPDGRLDLVPDAIGLPDVKETDTVAPLKRTKPPSKQRTKANLLTRHSLEELYERCKQIQVMNALVKQPGIQRLYLAAGFLQWQKPNSPHMARAPLLLFPAILARRTDEQACAERRYELRMDGCTPDVNLELIDTALNEWQIRLPDYNVGEPLSNWFGNVAESIRGVSGISLQLDIAVGTACPPKHLTELADGQPWLPELPDHFDAPLAMAIAQDLNLDELTTIMQLMGQPDQTNSHRFLEDAANDTSAPISQIHELAKRLADVGLEQVEFQHLDDLPTRLHAWSDCVRDTLKNPILNKLDNDRSLTALQLVRLSSMVELVDRQPKDFKSYIHPHLAYRSTRTLLRRAHHQARLIEQELQDLQAHFHLERIPSKKQLLNLIEELGGNNWSEPDVVDADYFNARRQFMEFSVDKPANLTIEHRRLLSQLAKVLRFRELFINNTEYRLALGPGYRGMKTQWAELESMVDYAIELSDHVESETVASRLLANWQSSQGLYMDDFDQLQSAADAMRKLLRVLGTAQRHTVVDKLVTRATLLANDLESWRAPELDLAAYTTKTAADVLACFPGTPRADGLTEAAVADAERRIRLHLKERNTEIQAIVDTLNWLQQASETATQQSLDIDAIVDRLNIA